MINSPSGQSPIPPPKEGLSVAICGSGGSGAITAGTILLDAIARRGYYGLMSRSLGPQIRGGESAAMVRFSTQPVGCQNDHYDLLIGLDWANFSRFSEEIPLNSNSSILSGSSSESLPPGLTATAKTLPLTINEIIQGIKGGRANMAALGIAGHLCKLPMATLEDAIRANLGSKGDEVVDVAIQCLHQGYKTAEHLPPYDHPAANPDKKGHLWNISGNEAGGLGALRGGIRFVAAYPITPASDMLEWMAPKLETLNGTLLQAEDELASVNMAIGASYGGVAAMTATSGPGLCLMTEGIGLAISAEIPLVIVNVSRGGPSTGIPTKSEQSDLNLALYGVHGDAPHLVLAPLSIADCATTTEWATSLAEQLQTVAIVLSDQFLGQARAITDPQSPKGDSVKRQTANPSQESYLRYQLTNDGVSPMAQPGASDCRYTAEGLEHNEQGLPSSMSKDHLAMLDKRQRKLQQFDFGEDWMESDGEGHVCILTWGSSTAVAKEAAARLRRQGLAIQVIALRLLAPLQTEPLLKLLEPMTRVVVVEQNHQGQLFHYLNAHQLLPANAESLCKPGPIPFTPGEITAQLSQETTT